MNRDQNPVWRQCLSVVEPILDSLGFTLAVESNLYSSFGSASTDYERVEVRTVSMLTNVAADKHFSDAASQQWL
ncbi:MAG: hypothetical protein ACJ799_04275 [Gemmatimonadaceae bacterium]